MDAIVGDHERILVKQAKEWGEILLGFEARNRFELFDDDGDPIGFAAEEGGGFGAAIMRNIFGRCRKATYHVYDVEGEEVGRGEKPWSWFFHRMELFEFDEKIGAIQRRWGWFNRLFTVEDAEGNELLTIKSPFFRIWTFKLLLGDKEVGRVSKKWGGLLKEAFSDADTFGVEFGHDDLPHEVKKLLVLSVFLIDLCHFENNNSRGGGISFGD
ncbi:MAG: phospholipid scramblase-related protein [Planctomycetota bacterium]